MTLLITGANGLLGSNFCFESCKHGLQITAICHQHLFNFPKIAIFSADLTNPAHVSDIVTQTNPDWIVHCAAWTNVDGCETDPVCAQLLNVTMTKHLAEAAALGKSKMVYISTDSVFDGQKGQYKETDQPNPINVYAKTKLAGEKIVQETLPERSLILRTNIFGWNLQNKKSLSEWVCHALSTGQSIQGFTDVVFSPLLVNTLSQFILQAMRQKVTGLYHVGSHDAINKYDFAVQIAQIFAIPSPKIQPISVDVVSFQASRPKNTSLNSERFAQALDQSMPTIADEINAFKQLQDVGFAQKLKNLAKG